MLAHNIVTAELVSPKGDSHPIEFRLYLKEAQAREKRVPFKTKIEPAQDLVEDALQRGLEIQGALFDNWFASKVHQISSGQEAALGDATQVRPQCED